jgi:hypothetical protein
LYTSYVHVHASHSDVILSFDQIHAPIYMLCNSELIIVLS